jgi:SAM-dependent methyltransferase
MNYERLYNFRFRDIDQDARIAVWQEIGPHVHGVMGEPQKVLDPAAGRGEFIGAVPARETWAVDEVSYPQAAHKPDTTVIVSSIMDTDLPEGHFDGVFVSNFLEHLHDQEAIASFLEKMNRSMETGGRIAIMGPNYRYCADE